VRPLTLKMSAFGPFAAVETIDFSLLGEQPLFLINGVTGAGKTTILDAICFSLYGKTTGDERDAGQMCCDYAANDALTYVELSFAIKDQFYRIKRIPEQARPKAKGEGFTRQAAQAQLWIIDQAGKEIKVIVSQKVTEANIEIENLTGLNVDQFRQVMVLPQGQFRKLLMADSKDREAIFSQLFATSVYKRIENTLKDQAAVLKREVGDILRLNADLLQSLDLQSGEQLDSQIGEIAHQEKAALTAKRAHNQQYLAATKTFEQAKNLKLAFDQLQQLVAQQQQHKQQQAHIVAVKNRLMRGEIAQTIDAAYQQKHNVELQIPSLETAYQQSLLSLEQSKVALQNSTLEQQRCPQIRQKIDTAKALHIEYKRHLKSADELRQLQTGRDKAGQEKTQAVLDVGKIQQKISTLKEEKQKVVVKIATQDAAIALIVDPQSTKNFAEQRIQQLNTIEQLRAQLLVIQQELQQLKASGAKVRTSTDKQLDGVRQLEMQWHLSQAQHLAQQLKIDEPCPVCGSKQHPNIASSEQVLVTLEQIDNAKVVAQQWEQKLVAQRERYSSVGAQYKALNAQLDSAVKQFSQYKNEWQQQNMAVEQFELLSYWEEVLLKAQSAITQLGDHKVHLQQAHKRTVQLDELQAQAELLHRNHNQLLMRADSTLAVIENELTRCLTQLPDEFKAIGALDSAIAELISGQLTLENEYTKITQAYTNAQGAQQAAQANSAAQQKALTSLNEQLAALIKLWQQALEDSSFSAQVDFLQARTPLPELQNMREEINAYELQRKEIEVAMQGQKNVILDQQEPNLANLEQQLTTLLSQQQGAEQEWLVIDKQLSHLQKVAKQIAVSVQKNAALEAQYKVVGTLSDVANGLTADKVSLQRFVLSALLDDVLIEASSRLHIMSKGRYQLIRKEQRAKGNKASGLELEVDDAYTGKVRSVATLSGGESFMAALALALGLSGVVQAYAGGIVLDTLFIDEGFGSLDAEALELAIRTLVDLQRSGRMIGIISHVAELKEQMPIRIDIHTDQQGSHLEIVS
jgi:exonuclease SbcC